MTKQNPRPATNPFRFGALALDEMFTDREREVTELKADVANGQDVVVFAPRRLGKSSLMWRAAQELVAGGVLVAQVDLMRTPTKERLAAALAKAIHEQIASPVGQIKDRLRVFSGLRLTPKVSVDPADGSFSFGFDPSSQADIDATLEELLALPGRIGSERGRQVALVFDEFQEVVDINPGLLKLMRSVFQEQPEVAHVYLGSRRHMMEQIFNDQNEPFWRSAKQMSLGPIPTGEFSAFAAARFSGTGKAVDKDALAAVMQATGGHPNATQELLYFLWEATPPSATAGLAEYRLAMENVLRSENAHFGLLWERAPAGQRLMLQALAAEQPARPLSVAYQRRHDLPSVSAAQTALEALVRDELVQRVARGEYRISEPFLAEWVTQNET